MLCVIATTAILVSSFFDPQLEGAQVAALLWTAFGVGVAVTSFRGWFSYETRTSTTSALGNLPGNIDRDRDAIDVKR